MTEQSSVATGDAPLVVVVPVDGDGKVGHSWGRAPRVAVATVAGGRITGWSEHQVGWDGLHDATTEGGHHARVVRFLQEQHVDVVVADHMGPPMARMITSMGLTHRLGAAGDAQAAVLAAVQPD